MKRWDVAIVGGGPAGLMAAASAAERGRRTILLDKNRAPGVKILLSGGTRCNLTHAADARDIVEAFGPNGRFLHSALAAFDPQAVVDWFEAEGVPAKIEPGGKVFPQSDRAADVRNALVRRVKQSGCTMALGEPVTELVRLDAGFQLVTPQRSITAEKLVLAVGGQSYPACGTTGDGYRLAAALGHRIVAPHEALVPVTSHARWATDLQGITLPDVCVRVVDPVSADGRGKERCLARRRGALLFAHFGVTGPVVLDISRAVSGSTHPTKLLLRCDLLPETPGPSLDARLAEVRAAGGKKRAVSLLDSLLPRRVGETLLALAGIPPDRPVAELSKAECRRLADQAKRLVIPVAGTMGFRKAEVTAGGVALDEIDSRTMESRIVPGLYVAGELLDLDGPVGGYNFQAAFSTGRLAGMSA